MNLLLTTSLCGCVVDGETLRLYGDVIECPWCLATFSMSDYRQWEPPMLILQPQAPLFTFGGKLIEFTGRCGKCATPVMREPKAEHERVKFHLPVDPRHFVRVWD